MKQGFVTVTICIFFLTGCVYQRPYGYSRYATTVTTPAYPSHYQEQHYYYTPAPPRYVIQPTPRRFYEEHHEREHNYDETRHRRSRESNEYHEHSEHSRPHQHW